MQSSTKSHTLSCTMDLQSSSPCYPFPGCIQLFCPTLPDPDCHRRTLEHALCMDCGAINAPLPDSAPLQQKLHVWKKAIPATRFVRSELKFSIGFLPFHCSKGFDRTLGLAVYFDQKMSALNGGFWFAGWTHFIWQIFRVISIIFVCLYYLSS